MKHLPGFYFDADSGGNNGGGSGDGNPPTTQTFTQEQLNALFADRAKRASDKAVSDLLAGLGVQDVDTLKAILEEGKKAKTAQQTEAEKAQERLRLAEEAAKKSKSDADALVATWQKKVLDTEIKVQAAAAIEGKRGAFRAEALDDVLLLIDRSGIAEKDGSYTGIAEALEALAKAKPWLLKDQDQRQPKGTPGTGGKPQNNKPPETQPNRPPLRL